MSSKYDNFEGLVMLTLRSLDVADKTIFMPEIQFIGISKTADMDPAPTAKPCMYFQWAWTGADLLWVWIGAELPTRSRGRNQHRLKFPGLEVKPTLIHYAKNCSRNKNYQSILLEDGVKVANCILSRSRGWIRANISKPRTRSRHQRLGRFWCRFHRRSMVSQSISVS